MTTAQSQPTQQTTAVQQVQAAPLSSIDSGYLPIEQIKRRIQQLGHLFKSVMVEGVDYGIIPGTGRPLPKGYEDLVKAGRQDAADDLVPPGMIVRETKDSSGRTSTKMYQAALLQSGANLTCQMFRITPEIAQCTPHDLPGGHREYDVTIRLRHMETGHIWGESGSICSTMESKYRYRGTQGESTGKPLPRAYWDARENGDAKKMEEILGGPGFFAKKSEDGQWEIFKKLAEKMENENPADQFHTCKMMAIKRAKVGAARVAGADRLFTQDLVDDDVDETSPDDLKPGARPTVAPPPPSNQQSTPQQQSRQPANDPTKTFEAFKPFGVTDADLEARIGAPANQWSDEEFRALRGVFSELRSGAKQPGDYFPRFKEAQASEITALRDRIWKVARDGGIPEPEITKTLKAHGIMGGMESIDGVDNVPVLTATAEALEKLATAKGGN